MGFPDCDVRRAVRLAAIDLGTVTSRLLIAEVREGQIHELQRHLRITHLGEGIDHTRVISAGAILREQAACRDFMQAIAACEQQDGIPVEQVIAVATSAMRDATNREEVCCALREAGVEITVISGAREAELSFLGATSGFSSEELSVSGATSGFSSGELSVSGATSGFTPGELSLGDAVMSLDVGGGSTEVILGLLGSRGVAQPKAQGTNLGPGLSGSRGVAPSILFAQSFDIGCRRVTDRFLMSDPPSLAELSSAKTWIESEMRDCFEQLKCRPQALIAVAGTATTVVSVRDEMKDYDPQKVHGAIVTADELDRVKEKLLALNLRERKRCTGLEPGRAEVIIGGLVILQAALELSGLDSFVVSETDILHGLILDAAR